MGLRRLGLAALSAALAAAAPLATAEPELPPAGRSLFDFLTTAGEGEGRTQRVPFPFEALLAHIGAQLEGGERAGVRSVLIPLGRSLQRDAGGAEVFRYPRVVAAVTGEPAAAAGAAGMLLKDRLYIGYHEKAAVLEVISYNEAAGRFEFQVVRDYRAGVPARVFYANRRMCLSCHQNAGPIFSRPPWDETNANPGLRKLLHAQKRDFYGIAVDRGAEVPNAIDLATDRANRFESVQRLWREGCEVSGRPAASARCRGAALAAALKFRLSGDRQIDIHAADFATDFAPVLAASWRARWPEGIAVPSPDLPNRDPLGALGETLLKQPSPARLRGAARITPELDPLAPREPIDLRFGARREDVELFVRNLAGFIAEPDVAELDRWLEHTHESTGGAVQRLQVPCRVIERESRRSQMQFACVSRPGASPHVELSGRLRTRGPEVLGGAFDRSQSSLGRLRDVEILPATIERTPAGAEVRLELGGGGLAFRLAGGGRVTRMVLRWGGSGEGFHGAHSAGEAEVWLADEFAPVARAIEAMIDDAQNGRGDALGEAPFRRAVAMKALGEKLGMPAREWCCVDPQGMPPPQTVADSAGRRRAAALAPLRRACAGCHAGAEPFPPGFLHGSQAAVLKSVDACAERMLYRLEMWRLPEAKRPKTPMPPLAEPPAAHAALAADLREIRRYLRQRVAARDGAAAPGARPYEQLARCTPAAH
jgi:hypothetical protein